jgi:hypothetical protein
MPKTSAKNVSVKSRSAVTGRQLGRAAKRSEHKNSVAVEEYVEAVEGAKTAEDLSWVATGQGLTVGRVTKAMGAGRLEVQLPDGGSANIVIAGAVKFKGHAATKGDRTNCMSVADFIVVRGSQAAGKMSRVVAARVQAVFERHGVVVCKGFFAPSGSSGGAAGTAEEDDIEWDRDEEGGEEKVEEEVDIDAV